MRTRWLMALLLSVATGCHLGTPSATKTTRTAATGRLPLGEAVRKVPKQGQALDLTGAIKLMAGKGGGVISNNGGNIISDNGLGIISDNGLGVISNNGGNLGARYGVLATAPESLLADAQIEVLDAEGRLLAGQDGKPITATSDASGRYHFKATLPDETLVLRIRLYQGGQLFAFIAKGRRTGALDIDTASSLGAAYVLDRYVKKRQDVLDRLPASEADALQSVLNAARGQLGAASVTYKPQDLVAQTEKLRTAASDVDSRLKTIEAILLAGQKDLGNGLVATQVALATPSGLIGDGQGNVWVSETTGGRVRRIAADGTIRPFAGGIGAVSLVDGQDATECALGAVYGITRGPNGDLYAALSTAGRVVRIGADGKVHFVAGTGRQGPGKVDVPALEATLVWPGTLTFGADGSLFIGERPRDGSSTGRLLRVDPQGILHEESPPPGGGDMSNIPGIVAEKDGTLWAVVDLHDKGTVSRKPPGGAWQVLATGLDCGLNSELIPAGDGGVLLSESLGGRVLKLDAQGTLTPIIGKGAGGEAETALTKEAAGLWLAPDGTLYFVDASNAQVKALGKDGHVRTVAGASGIVESGDALAVSINQPAGLATDGQGRLAIVEAASATIKRLDGKTLSTIAGTQRGFGGDGGQAAKAAFDGPFGVTYVGEDLYVADTLNHRIRKVDAKGVVTTVVGDGGIGTVSSVAPSAAIGPVMRQPMYLAVGPDGLVYWTDNANATVCRLKNGLVELVAGSPGASAQGDSGDGGPATKAQLSHPVGLAFSPSGELYIADTGNMRVRKVDKAGVITTAAGVSLAELLPKVLAGASESGDGGPAAKAVLMGPAGLCFDKAGNLYITELGTQSASTLTGVVGGADLPIPLTALPKVPARIRKVAPDGTISTIAGPGSPLLSDPTAENALQAPVAVVIDGQGQLIVADANANQVKLLPKGSY